MTQQTTPYFDKGYPLQASTHETKMQLCKVQKSCDAHCWNETEEKSHDRYVDIEKYKTVERSECVVRFVGKVTKRAGRIHNYYFPRRLIG